MKISKPPASWIPPTWAKPDVEPVMTPELRAKWDSMYANGMQKPAKLLEERSDGKLHIDNVRWGFDETSEDPTQWQPRFKDMLIDPKTVKSVSVAIEPFAPKYIGGHGEAVIEFSEPFTNRDGEKDTRLVISMEAFLPKGEKYGMLKGMKKNFGSVFQLGSFSDRVQRVCRKEGRSINLHEIEMTPKQRYDFTMAALGVATTERDGEWYHSLKNSCFASIVELLNSVMPPEKQISRWTTVMERPRLAATLPSTAGVVLERKGLWTDGVRTEIVPDTRMWPESKATWLTSASQKPWWGTAGRALGTGLGAALASSVGGDIGAILGGLAGYWSGGVVADHIRIHEGTQKVSPDSYYPQHVKDKLGIS
jgi:hypothetical protein